MAAGILVVELIVVFSLAVFLLHIYGNWRRQHVIVSFATLISWYFAFVIVFLLPLDVVLTFFNRCENKSINLNNSSLINSSTPFSTVTDCKKPSSYIPRESLLNLWEVVYWTSQILTWCILPVMQSYCKAGEFTAIGKIKFALFENAIFYGSYLLILGVLLIYIAAKGVSLTGTNLKTIAITASNTWGLFWLVLLSGYGLVEVPRQVWLTGVKGYSLQKTYFDVEKLSTERNDAEETLRESFRDSKSASESLRDANRLRPYVEIIMKKFPDVLTNQLTGRTGTASSSYRISSSDVANMPSEKNLVSLHKRVIDSLRAHYRCEAQWTALISRALHLEDVARNESNLDKVFLRTYKKRRGFIEEAVCTSKLEWYWECFLKRPLMKVIGILCALMSVFIVWSEVTFFSVSPTLSLAAIFVHLAAKDASYDYIELSSMVTILYMCVCAYYTVFRIKIYRYYHLDPHHHTDENSLLFSAILLCRLTPPLCLNFLGLIHMDSHVTKDNAILLDETAYTSFMGHMDVIPFIASGFNIYFPMAILILCLGTYFRLGTRCLHYIGIEQFIGEDDMTAELVQGGKALVSAERNKLQRSTDREARDEFWRDKLGDHDPSKPLKRNLGDKRSFPGGSVSQSSSFGDRALIVENAEPIATVSDDPFNDPNNWFGGSSRATTANNSRGIFDDL